MQGPQDQRYVGNGQNAQANSAFSGIAFAPPAYSYPYPQSHPSQQPQPFQPSHPSQYPQQNFFPSGYIPPNPQPYMPFSAQAAPPQQMENPSQIAKFDTEAFLPKDKKHFGNMWGFLGTLAFGFLLPLMSCIVIFAMETSHLSRIGVLMGNANMFIWMGSFVISLQRFVQDMQSVHYDGDDNNHTAQSGESSYFLYWIALPLIIIGFVFYGISFRLFKKFVREYSAEGAERMQVHSPAGSCRSFLPAFLISFFFPIVGSTIVVLATKNLRGRYGALAGMAAMLIALGIMSVPIWVLSFITGNPMLLIGLTLLECSIIHFRRAIISAELSQRVPQSQF